MANSEFEMVKEIPGYKMILKAVLKSQIQQLVQQLAVQTDEESIILTASVADGTLSHLGSDSGKTFLENHEDIKSQFLGFCLRSRHKHIFEKGETTGVLTTSPMPVHTHLSPKAASPQHQVRASSRSSPRLRHEPYSVKRSSNKRTPDVEKSTSQIEANTVTSELEIPSVVLDDSIEVKTSKPEIPSVVLDDSIEVKIEHPEGTEESASIREFSDLEDENVKIVIQSVRKEETFENQSTSQNEATFQSETERTFLDSDNGSTPLSENTDRAIPEGLFMNSGFASVVTMEKSESVNKTESDIDTDVKVEAISESDMELEITGIEPGEVTYEHSTDMTFTPKGDATGSQGDTSIQPPQNCMVGDEENGVVEGEDAQELNENEILHEGAEENKVEALSDQEECADISYSPEDDNNEGALEENAAGHSEVVCPPEDALQEVKDTSNDKECGICGKTYKSKDLLKRHVRSSHYDNVIQCHVCHKVFDTEEAKQKHIEEKHAKKHQLCCHCGKVFGQKGHLNEHIRYKHSNESVELLKCPFKNCDRKFARKTLYQDHLNTHTKTKPYSCNKCKKCFSCRYAERRHELTCVEGRTYQCQECDKQFSENRSLTYHIQGAHRSERFICACGASYRYQTNLYRHKKKCSH